MKLAPILLSLALAGCADDGADEVSVDAIGDGKADNLGLPAPGDTAGRVYFDHDETWFTSSGPEYHVFTARGGHTFTITASSIDDDGGDVLTDAQLGIKLYRLAQHASGKLYWRLITSVDSDQGVAAQSYKALVARWYMVETAAGNDSGKLLLQLSCAGGGHASCALAGQPNDACKKSKSCDGGLYCQFPVGSCGTTAGTCQISPASCPKLGLACFPVCGCDGNTYCNGCDVTQNRVSVAHTGQCGCDPTVFTPATYIASSGSNWGYVDPATNDHYSYSFFGKGGVTSEHDPGCLFATPACAAPIHLKQGSYSFTSPSQITINYQDGTSAVFDGQSNCYNQDQLVGNDWGRSLTLSPQ